jgi:transposase InsO family protein
MMDEKQQKEVALFRFAVISDFVTRSRMDHGEQEKLLHEKSEKQWQIPFSERTRIGRSTIHGWIKRYRQSGGKLESLYPAARSDKGFSRAIDEQTGEILIRLRQELPKSPVSGIVAEMRRRGLIRPGLRLRTTTVYRFFKRKELLHPRPASPVDRRKFEAELPNDLWQSDSMHGPFILVGEKRKKTYLFAFIDDMSRLIPHAQFYLSEKLDSYLDALRQALLKRGLPRKLYVDNGPAFRSLHLREITASLGIALVHSKPYKPQGRGKIERLFRTIQSQFLPGFKGTTLEELNEALDCWIRDIYHSRAHGATGQSPLSRFADHMECIRPSPKDLEDYFRKRARRRVANDRSVSLNGKLYEAPVALIGRQLTLLYHEHDPTRIEIQLEGKSYGFLRSLDLHLNCRIHRRSEHLCLEADTHRPIFSGKLSFRSMEEEKS